ncbi:single-stranded DNA-binding protein [Entomobacter blattae]|uniref:Single-stranded DNA-binding protein n=1 Tax=Entomobacter blattae TaxID=2762277 RepID=A0A7H1NRL8_9PROT|nr:single-stranded DNA-binding protein [Entomobacter blattae]QNT77583.1 Single-stranded DNA-binding protein [Entomobacter blattae]QNT78428.1 Single-stranded DNA-binding protein [Entomobacter blattae]
MSLNCVQIIGRMGKEPVIRQASNGKRFATFSLATGSKYEKDGKEHDTTQWHEVVVWNEFFVNQTEERGKKGVLVSLEGELSYSDYTDEKGVSHKTVSIAVRRFPHSISFLQATGKKSENDSSENPW